MNKNEANPTWQLLRDRWAIVEKHADEIATSYANGLAFNTHEREAWLNIQQIALHADCMDVIEVVLAMYLLQEEQPYRFKSDLAFDGQLVRRVRSLAPCNIGEYRDYKTGKIQRVYRDAKPKTVEIVARLLKEAFGVAGLTVGRLERAELSKQRQEAGALYNALGDLL